MDETETWMSAWKYQEHTSTYVVFEKVFVLLVIGLKNLFKELVTLFSNYYS